MEIRKKYFTLCSWGYDLPTLFNRANLSFGNVHNISVRHLPLKSKAYMENLITEYYNANPGEFTKIDNGPRPISSYDVYRDALVFGSSYMRSVSSVATQDELRSMQEECNRLAADIAQRQLELGQQTITVVPVDYTGPMQFETVQPIQSGAAIQLTSTPSGSSYINELYEAFINGEPLTGLYREPYEPSTTDDEGDDENN